MPKPRFREIERQQRQRAKREKRQLRRQAKRAVAKRQEVAVLLALTLWAPIKAANQSFVFDEISVNTLKARGLSFEPMFTGRPDYWIGP